MIGHSTAKLYGIEVVEGSIKVKQPKEKQKKASLNYLKLIAEPRNVDVSDIEKESAPTFKPMKSKEVLDCIGIFIKYIMQII